VNLPADSPIPNPFSWSHTGFAESAEQSVPLGNGDFCANAWLTRDGYLNLYLAKSDALGARAELLKIGYVRIGFEGNPFDGQSPTLTLDLKRGVLGCTVEDAGAPAVTFECWIDAHNDVLEYRARTREAQVLRVESILLRPKPRRFARPGSPWAGEPSNMFYAMFREDETELLLDADFRMDAGPHRLAWAHRNSYSVRDDNLKVLGLTAYADDVPDPLKDNTFGSLVVAQGCIKTGEGRLEAASPGREHRCQVYIHVAQTESADQWLLELLKKPLREESDAARKSAHEAWWNAKYSNSYIVPHGSAEADKVAAGYQLQRYVTLCAGRGVNPMHFNGSLFTVGWQVHTFLSGLEHCDPDYRRWGSMFMFQNTRLNYWPLLVAGDLDCFRPWVEFMRRILPIAIAMCREYFGIEGIIMFEGMSHFGTPVHQGFSKFQDVRAAMKSFWGASYRSCVLEAVLLLLDYYAFSNDRETLKGVIIPYLDGVCAFYSGHYRRDAEGKLLIEATALETYHDALNPMPDVAGLRTVFTEALRLGADTLSAEQISAYTALLECVPELPTRPAPHDYGFEAGMVVKYDHVVNLSRPAPVSQPGESLLAPAQLVRTQAWNIENPELYAVFPYRQVTVARGNLDLGRRSYHDRMFHHSLGWAQDPIQAACLGLADEARRQVARRYDQRHAFAIFPAFWRANFDWIPDQDNGGVANKALQAMLIQYDEDQVYLLPAWPGQWDVEFAVFAPGGHCIAGSVRDGTLSLESMPGCEALQYDAATCTRFTLPGWPS